MAKIVVGVDGSDGSMRALKWAVAEARLRSAHLEVVCSYPPNSLAEPQFYPTEHAYPSPLAAEYPPPLTELGADVVEERENVRLAHHSNAERLIAHMLGALDEDTSDMSIERSAVSERNPAMALVERSDGADLVVVGNRGRGGFEALVLGSVSYATVHHATCPVVVVPKAARGAKADKQGRSAHSSAAGG